MGRTSKRTNGHDGPHKYNFTKYGYFQVNNPDRFYYFDFINDSMSMIKSCYKLYLMKLNESFGIFPNNSIVVDKNYDFNALDKTINDFYKTVITPEWEM